MDHLHPDSGISHPPLAQAVTPPGMVTAEEAGAVLRTGVSEFKVILAHAPIPVYVLNPREKMPLHSTDGLMKYIGQHREGIVRHIECDDEEEAMAIFNAQVIIPPGSMWLKRLMHKEEIVTEKSGIKNKLEHTAR